jgi:hypothetical protein
MRAMEAPGSARGSMNARKEASFEECRHHRGAGHLGVEVMRRDHYDVAYTDLERVRLHD